MELTVQNFLSVLFNEDEEVCASPNKYGYTSVPVEDLTKRSTIDIISKDNRLNSVETSEIQLIAINPIKGDRKDENVTHFRNFLVELDDRPLDEQALYVDSFKVPYSASVFSGNKSIHFAICLEESLPSIEIYRFYSTWILNIVKCADQNTKNPSRSIRYPGNYRDGNKQELLSLRPRISLDQFKTWISQYEGLAPVIKKQTDLVYKDYSHDNIPRWVKRQLSEGIDFSKGRNNTWFNLGLGLAKGGCDEDNAIEILEPYFEEEYDFRRLEWETSIKSGVKKIRQTL